MIASLGGRMSASKMPRSCGPRRCIASITSEPRKSVSASPQNSKRLPRSLGHSRSRRSARRSTAAIVKESQRLNRLMVMLTIAISGGPFLGLLGTVVGVMITFAAIAASGDVNVNAIAPGIAAALVATVAGLGVAIPALFGYNYLISASRT